MSTFLPGKPNARRRRAAMQAAVFNSRERRLDRVEASQTPVVVPPTWLTSGNRSSLAGALATEWGSNASNFNTATKVIFSILDVHGTDQTAYLNSLLGKTLTCVFVKGIGAGPFSTAVKHFVLASRDVADDRTGFLAFNITSPFISGSTDGRDNTTFTHS